MSTVLQIYEAIDRLAPFSLSMDFDNTGILVGDRQKKVGRALLALDCTKEVLRQAKELGAQLIITHHPIIFHPIKRVNEDSLVYHLLRSDIAVISAHTNLDIAQGGVNDLLAKRIGLSDCRGLQPMDAQGTFFLGRIGSLPEGMEPQQFAQYLKQRLGAPSVKFAAADRTVKTVALCGGAGRRWGPGLLVGLTALISLWMGSQTIYYHLFKTFLTLFSLTKMAMVAGAFGDMAVGEILLNWFPILMMAVPVVLAFLFRNRVCSGRPLLSRMPLKWVGLAAAVSRLSKNMKSRDAAVRALNQQLREGLKAFPEVEINSPDSAVPEVLNFSENCIKSETMLAFLAEEQIYVSSASACGRGQPSHTLAAMGRSPLAIDTAIRVSFCADNTPEDVDAFLNRFEDGMKHLQRIRR